MSENDAPKPDPAPANPPDPLPDDAFEPVGRDGKFIVRLVLAMIVGLGAAAFVGAKIRSAAAGCGAGLVGPHSMVLPPDDGGR